MNLISNMRIWQKTLAPLVCLGVLAVGITLFMSNRMGGIDDAYSLLIDREAKVAIEAVKADTITAELWALAYKTIVETDVPKMQSLIREMQESRGRYEASLDKIRRAFSGQAEIEARLHGLDTKFTALVDIAVRAGTLSLQNTTEANAQAAKLMENEFQPAREVLRGASEDFLTKMVTQLDTGSAALTDHTSVTRTSSTLGAIAAVVICLAVGLWVTLRAPFKTSDTKLAGISTNMQGL